MGQRAQAVLVAALLVLGAPALYVIGAQVPAGAAVFTVDSTADGAPVASHCTDGTANNCTVRDSFAAAAASAEDNVIELQAGVVYQLTDCSELDVNFNSGFNLTLNGNGATIQQTCPAAADARVLRFLGFAKTFTMNDTTLTGANATSGGGGIEAGNDAVSIVINRSTITGNTATFGAGVATAGSLTVRNSTISGNTASVGDGGGLRTFNDPITLINSTVTGNHASTGGGGLWSTQSNVVLVYSTVTGNTAATGANVQAGGTISSFGSVVASPLGVGANCSGTTSSNGYNLSDDTSCGFTGTGDRQGAANNPLLGALTANGGPTKTMLPGATSPLLDALPLGVCQSDGAAGIVVDQRSLARPSPAGGACDIGAVEVQVTTPITPETPGAPTPVTVTPAFAG